MSRVCTYRSSVLSYEIYGKGQPVVLLHGFGEDSRIWDEQVSFLKGHCQLVVPDLPGSGKSGLLQPLSDKEPVTIETYADCIHVLLQSAAITQCIMLGHSMGGYITLAFAEKYPQTLKAYGLVHSTAFADTEEKKKARERGIELIENYGAHAFLKNTIPNLFSESYKRRSPERVTKLIEETIQFSKEALQQYYRAMILRPDRTYVLKSNRLPVLFVIGTEDIAAPVADVLQQVSLPEISYIYVLPDTGHMGMWESADQLNQLLLTFINS